MRPHLLVLLAGVSLTASAAPPKPLVELAAAIDGAKRNDGKKECSFVVEKPECALAVRVTCAAPLFTYSYVMTLPLSKLDPKRSAYQKDAGGFRGAHGVELTATGAPIVTVTDDGQRTNGEVVVLAFGTGDDDEKRARKVISTLLGAKAACR